MKPRTNPDVTAYRKPSVDRYLAQLDAGTANANEWTPEGEFTLSMVPAWLKNDAVVALAARAKAPVAKTTKTKDTKIHEVTVEEPDDDDDADPDEDPDDDDDDDDREDEAAADRTKVRASLRSGRGETGAPHSKLIDEAVRAMGLTGARETAFRKEAARDLATAGRPGATHGDPVVIAMPAPKTPRKAALATAANDPTAPVVEMAPMLDEFPR